MKLFRASIFLTIFFVLFVFSVSYAQADITTGLVGWWKLDDGSGTNASDSSGNSYSGTLINNPVWASGHVGTGSLLLDGADDYISVSSASSLDNVFDGGGAVSFWYKPNSAGEADAGSWMIKGGGVWSIFANSSHNLNETGFEFNIDWSGGTAKWRIDTTSPKISFGSWHHILLVYNSDSTSNNPTLYVDGTAVTLTNVVAPSGTRVSDSGSLLIGSNDATSRASDGTIDDIRMYSRSLSGSDISELYSYTDNTGDITPPVISSIASSTNSTTASITWTTDENSTSTVSYGLTTSYGSASTSAYFVTSHLITLSGLTANTQYHYKVSSTDSSGNTSYSSDKTFTTLASGVGGQSTTSITQYGITWSFSASAEYGQFANGDYWVVGPVTITSITPDFQQYSFGGTLRWINGWEVNPSHIDKQGFDERASYWDGTVVPNLPYTVEPGSSIVKSDSYEEAGIDCKTNPYATNNGPCLYTAAVLTIVDSPPPDNGTTIFRPPYFGTSKPYFSTTSLQTNLLPSLTPVGSSVPTLAWVKSRFDRVQLDHVGVDNGIYGGAFIHPDQNMPEYPADMARDVGDSVLRLELDDSIDQKMPALISFLQAGIDYYYMYLGGMKWWAGGGYAIGRKLPIELFALLYGDSSIQNTVKDIPISHYNYFGEDGSYQIAPTKTNDGERLIVFGNPAGGCNESTYWSALASISGAKDCDDPYGYIDGGELPGQSYQQLNVGPSRGISIATRLISGLTTLWNYQPFFDYTERMVNFGGWSQPDPCAPYDGVWANYGVTFGPNGSGGCIQDTNSSDGVGRFPNDQGVSKDTNLYGSSFAYDMWNAYDSTVDISAPVLMTISTSTTSTTATITWTTNESSDSSISYGLSSLYGLASSSPTLTTSHSITLTGLNVSSIYHFRIESDDARSNIATSTDRHFTTTSGLASAPTLSTGSASSVIDTSATLGGDITATGGATPTIRGFEYGLTTGYGATISESGSYSAGSYTLSISSLTCNTTYNFRSYATNSSGTDYGSNVTFTTSACASSSSSVSSRSGGGGGGGGSSSYLPIGLKTSVLSANQLSELGQFVELLIAIGVISPDKIDKARAFVQSQSKSSVSGVANVTCVGFLCNLYSSNSTSDIKLLQTILAKDPSVYPEGLITGTLGPLTRTAIQKFQVKWNIANPGDTAYGYVGNLTKAKLKELLNTTSTTPIAPPTTSVPPTTVTPTTTTKPPTPVTTTTKPTPVYSFTRTLSQGQEGEDVRFLQKILNTLGYTVAPLGTTGSPGLEGTTFDTNTKSALTRFQEAQGIFPASGTMGVITQSKLMDGWMSRK